ncbi:MAG: hypothetical protein COX57_01895 [Alphaproteobacteria bacterium CG_4_10_14_0_2_um_filter_63_37]|nr:MAG: hypothetical protein AUJ55_10870 [Proteobacteria bacterium CG1_02_64_396]PJA25760.1 MAG: hypothetical protein COX57_01895 [Alphaproteobacteria bacterium CG_4_10_14_0_2_um_filter_63_37]
MNTSIPIKSLLFGSAVCIALSGCFVASSSTKPVPTVTIQGTVVVTPVGGATVTVYTLKTGGARGAAVAGPFATNGSGSWVGRIPAGASLPLEVVASGGNYVDPATGASVAMGGELRGLIETLPGADAILTVAVTPLTHAADLRARSLAAGGMAITTAAARARIETRNRFGIDPFATEPVDPLNLPAGSSAAQKQYAALLGGLALLGRDPALTVAGLGGADPFAVNVALSDDLADGKLDGIGASGGAIAVSTGTGTTVPLPPLDPAGVNALVVAAYNFAAAPPLGGVPLEIRARVVRTGLVGGGIIGASLSLAGAVTTVAGTAGIGGAVDNAGPLAQFNGPYSLTGNGTYLYVADFGNSTIRRIDPANGMVTTLAGSPGTWGGADGIGAAASFNGPSGIVCDGASLYVADYANHTIRKIDLATTRVTTLAGTAGLSGSGDGVGAAARFNNPYGITTDGIDLYVSDYGNSTIRRIDPITGAVTTLAGSAGVWGSDDGVGTAATFNGPYGIACDGASLFVADSGNNTIRQILITPQTVTTLAGTTGQGGASDGIGAAARFANPQGIAGDGSTLYVTDRSTG